VARCALFRSVLGVAVVCVGLAGALPADAAAQTLIASRKRVLNETAHAQMLSAAEASQTAALQSEVDSVKEALTAEEQELARLRATLDRESFEQRVADFDRRVRRERRETQERAARMQTAFRDERVKLVEALGPVLDAVRVAHGASVILNSDVVLAADPALDVTDEVIARFNATVPLPTIPPVPPASTVPDDR
jgi:Skp family chaperone for outer membrane proteins